MSKKLTTKEFIQKAKEIHGNKYDYSLVEYNGTFIPVKIVCPKHGIFEQSPNVHLSNHGCPKCASKTSDIKKETLIDLHYNQKKTLREISRILNLNRNTVSKLFKKYGIEVKFFREKYEIDIEKIRKMNYEEGLTLKEISKKINIPYYTLSKKLKQKGYIARSLEKEKNIEQILYLRNNEKMTFKEIGNILGCSDVSLMKYLKNNGYKTNRLSISNYERKMCEFLNEIGIDYIQNERDIISSEIDIYIPKYKVGIEINGCYWHSENFKDKWYHYNKTKECEEKGIFLYHFWDVECEEKFDIIKSILMNKFGMSKRIYARKCEIKEIDNVVYKSFLEENHLNGYVYAKYRYGLYYDDKLVSVLGIDKPRFNENYDLEIIRYCNKKYHNVVGGFGKLFKQFKKYKVVSYVVRRFGSGKFYLKNGWKYIRNNPPNYYYYYNSKLYNKSAFRKNKIKKRFGVDVNGKTEKELCEMLGIYRVWDVGVKVFEWIP